MPSPLEVEILDEIARAQQLGNPIPTYRELAVKLKQKHYSTIAQAIRRLKKQGLLLCDFNSARTCRIPPENQTVFEDKVYHITWKGD